MPNWNDYDSGIEALVRSVTPESDQKDSNESMTLNDLLLKVSEVDDCYAVRELC